MANIDNAQAVRFVNENVRPMAEKLRAIKALVDAQLQTWNSGVNTLFSNDASPLADNRETEGVSRLTGADINAFMTVLSGLQTRFNLAGVANTVDKPCVNTFTVNL